MKNSLVKSDRPASLQKQANFDLGKMLGDAGTYAKNMYNQIPEGVRSGMGMGGLGGAALGGLAGLMAPGEEDVHDGAGNVVGRKSRNRFGAALRGLLGGGVLGAGAGAAAGHFAPDAVNSAYGSAMNFGSDLARRMGFRGKSDTAVTPTTAAPANLGVTQGEETINNPLYKGPNTSNMRPPVSPTYTPTDEAGIAARRAAAAAAEQAKFDRTQEMTMGPLAYAKFKEQQAARANQSRMDEEAGIGNVSPEVMALKQNNPQEFERMMQSVRNRQVEDNLRTAPNRGFDASGIDMNTMRPPASATMGR